MKILITGSKGMLAQDLIPVLEERHEVFAPPEEELDITRRDVLYNAVNTALPNLVINCAAYTNV
ncbi:MAG: sugar nucleotide-binding protein, partial [Nitrospirota bacterium]|nr:sugar nucleotide-binding protein [Nitrospirota bacterium]